MFIKLVANCGFIHIESKKCQGDDFRVDVFNVTMTRFDFLWLIFIDFVWNINLYLMNSKT